MLIQCVGAYWPSAVVHATVAIQCHMVSLLLLVQHRCTVDACCGAHMVLIAVLWLYCALLVLNNNEHYSHITAMSTMWLSLLLLMQQ